MRKRANFIRYLKTHIWVEIFSSVALVSIALLVVIYLYLQNQYYSRMLQDMKNADHVVIGAAVNSLNNIIEYQLTQGSEIGMNEQVLDLTDTVAHSDQKTSSALRRLRNELSLMTHYSEDIAAVTVVNEAGVICEYGRYWDANGTPKLWTGENLDIAKGMLQQVLARLKSRTPGYYYVSAEPAWRVDPPRMNLYHIAFPLIGTKSNLDQVDAVIIMSYHLQNIARTSMLTGVEGEENSHIYLVDAEGGIVYHEDSAFVGENEARYLADHNLSAVSQPLDYFGWRVAVAIDEALLRQDVSRMFLRSGLTYAVVILLALAGWSLLLRRILKPIGAVREAMEAAEKGNPTKIDIHGEHEIWSLATEYNALLDALDQQKRKAEQEYQEKMYLAEARNRAERIALESQISSHFLFNTLNAINFSIMDAGNYEAARMIKQLSNILRYALSQGEEVTIGREFDIAEQYLSLQKCRLMDKFDYEVDFSEDYSDWPCCKMFLQPFIENAIVHGFENINSGGRITVTGDVDEGRFRVDIADNGCGMPEAIQERIRGYFRTLQPLEGGESKGIGTKNVIMRMKMFFGPAFTAELESAAETGTRFTFWLPIPETDGGEG